MTDIGQPETVSAEVADAAVEAPAPVRSKSRYDRSLIEGPLRPAVWKLAWPTILTNIVGGLQGMIDHVMVGNLVGFQANAAIGVSYQIFIVVIVFISSLFTGMSVLVARFAGAGEEENVDRAVYQAFLTAIGLSLFIMAPTGYFLAPGLLDLVNAAPEVQAEALPFLRVMFLFSSGLLVFFMLGGALRSAGDARTPMVLGIALTALNLVLNIIFIRGLGPIPSYGTTGAAMGTVIASGIVALYSLARLWGGGWVVSFPRNRGLGPDWAIIRELFRFGLPTGIQGIAMNVGGVLLLAYIGSLAQSAAAQAAYAVGYTQLFSLITWTAMGLMGAAATLAGQNLGAGQPDRVLDAVRTSARIALGASILIGAMFVAIPAQLLALFGMNEPTVVSLGIDLLQLLSLSGVFLAVALTYTGGLQGTGDTKSPLYISIVSQLILPLGICFVVQQTSTLDPIDIWLAIVAGHAARCTLSVWRFRQGRWQNIGIRVPSEAEPAEA